MPIVRLKLDISGTVGDEVWRNLKHFDQIQSASYDVASSGACRHAPDQPHLKGEWRKAEIRVETSLLAQYAVAHYLEQPRVLDADVEESG
jgi:hypothetical protein